VLDRVPPGAEERGVVATAMHHGERLGTMIPA
jgi:hypothetical protein